MKTKKIAFSVAVLLLVTGALLEILPRSLFAGELQNVVLSYLRENCSALQYSYELAEKLYPGYGPKFVLSQLFLLATFVVASMISVARVWLLNSPDTDDSLEDVEFGREKRVFTAVILLAALVIVQIYFVNFPLSPSGGSGSATPFLFRSLIWSAISTAMIIVAVIWRRGALGYAK